MSSFKHYPFILLFTNNYFRLNERSGNIFVLESVFDIDVDNIMVKKFIL